MAATNPLEDLLSSEVDENEVSALVGSLESRLASPTHKEPAQEIAEGVVNNNHVNNTGTCVASSTVASPQFTSIQPTSQGQKGIPVPNNTTVNKINVPISKPPLDAQILGISSILNSTNASPTTGGVSLLSVNTPNSVRVSDNGKLQNASTLRIINQPQTIITSSGPSAVNVNNTNAVTYVHSVPRPLAPVVESTNGVNTQQSVTSSVVVSDSNAAAASAIYNFASIAAEQKPLAVPHLNSSQAKAGLEGGRITVREQIEQRQDKSGKITPVVTLSNVSPAAQFIVKDSSHVQVKQEHPSGPFLVKPDASDHKAEQVPQAIISSSSQDVHARNNAANVHIFNTNLKGTAVSVNPNMITVSRTQPHAMTVVRPHIVTAQSSPGNGAAAHMQIVTVNNPTTGGGVPRTITANSGVTAKSLPTRVTGSVRISSTPQQQQINIAPRPGATTSTITLPAGFHLQPGTVLVKNEQGQFMLVQAGQPGGLQPQTSTGAAAGSVMPTKIQSAKNLKKPMSTPAIRARDHMDKPLASQSQPRPPVSQTIFTIHQPQGQTAGSQQPTVLRHAAPSVTTPQPVASLQQTSATPTLQVSAVTQSTPTVVGQPPPAIPSTVNVPHSLASQNNMYENVKKCKNFLATLIKLAASQPPETVRNVRELIQGLIDGRVEPEIFTEKLQTELKSSPQPYLVPFLKKSLPLLRHSLIMNKMTIDGVRPPPVEVLQQQSMTLTAPPPPVQQQQSTHRSHLQMSTTPSSHQMMQSLPHMQPLAQAAIKHPVHSHLQQIQVRNQGKGVVSTHIGPHGISRGLTPNKSNLLNALPTTVSALQAHVTLSNRQDSGMAGAIHKEKRKYESLKDDDDINDVATMGGVNLTEESRNILATNAEFIGTQIRSCRDETFLYHGPLLSRITAIAKKYGIEEVPSEVANIISHATQERLRDFVEKLSTIAEHRSEIYKMDSRYEVKNDVRSTLKQFEELERLEKKRHEEQEREMLLRVAKSRSKHEDPEQLKLKQKAKEMQQAEMEEMRQREANITALAAIGPRKKRKTEIGEPNQGSLGMSMANGFGSSSVRPVMSRPRTKRVNLRDLMFLMEQDRSLSRSMVLYKSFLK